MIFLHARLEAYITVSLGLLLLIFRLLEAIEFNYQCLFTGPIPRHYRFGHLPKGWESARPDEKEVCQINLALLAGLVDFKRSVVVPDVEIREAPLKKDAVRVLRKTSHMLNDPIVLQLQPGSFEFNHRQFWQRVLQPDDSELGGNMIHHGAAFRWILLRLIIMHGDICFDPHILIIYRVYFITLFGIDKGFLLFFYILY